MTSSSSYDYIFCGGGTAACVVASRLHQYLPDARILVLERGAGASALDNPIITGLPSPAMATSDLQSLYQTVPQAQLNGRKITLKAGCLLSGSSGVNYGAWQRGHKNDYDRWAELAGVGGERFSYDSLLPYFKRIENRTQVDPGWDREQYGFDGPIKTTAWVDYPLKDGIRRGLEETGNSLEPRYHGGRPVGFAEYAQNWNEGLRQPAAKVYSLDGIEVETGVMVNTVTMEGARGGLRAAGVKTADGRIYSANKEVVICCGALKTPQLLLSSGIGGKEELASIGIEQIVDSPCVGKGLWDHLTFFQAWKLRQPEQGLAFGSTKFDRREYGYGLPVDWICGTCFSKEQLEGVLLTDHEDLIDKEKSHAATMIAYAPLSLNKDYKIPLDGSVVTSMTILFQPASTGTVTAGSTESSTDPIVDPQFLSKEVDRAMLRQAVRTTVALLESKALQGVADGEIAPEGWEPLTSKSSDADIDKRLQEYVEIIFHPAGTAALGKVVDARMRVKGVNGLRVIDASIFPSPASFFPQSTVYAIGEMGAELMAEDARHSE